MTRKDHLQKTAIVDKNGKHTHVLKGTRPRVSVEVPTKPEPLIEPAPQTAPTVNILDAFDEPWDEQGEVNAIDNWRESIEAVERHIVKLGLNPDDYNLSDLSDRLDEQFIDGYEDYTDEAVSELLDEFPSDARLYGTDDGNDVAPLPNTPEAALGFLRKNYGDYINTDTKYEQDTEGIITETDISFDDDHMLITRTEYTNLNQHSTALSFTEGLPDDSDLPRDENDHFIEGPELDRYVDAVVVNIRAHFAADDAEFTRHDDEEQLDDATVHHLSEASGIEGNVFQRQIRFSSVWKSPEVNRDDVLGYLRESDLLPR